jgi:hypothetical protein
MTKNNARKGVSLLLIILLITVSPTIMLSYDNNVGLAQAQDANQTSSSAATPSSPPSTQSPQTMQNTFRAEGVIGTLILDPNAISDAPPPSKFFGTIVGGNWSLAVVDRNIQNLTVNLLSIRPNGTIAEAAVISTITNIQELRLLRAFQMLLLLPQRAVIRKTTTTPPLLTIPLSCRELQM